MRRRTRRFLAKLAVRLLPNGPVLTYTLWSLGLPPFAGAEGDDPPKKDDPPKDDPPKDDPEWTPPSKDDWDNAQRKAREAEERAKRLADEKAEAERKQAEDSGKFKELYEREKADREREQEERERKDTEREQERRRDRAERIADKLKFKDPADVLHRLSESELETEAKTEKALKKLAEQKKYLIVDGDKRTNRDPGDDDDPDETKSGDGKVFGRARLARGYAAASKDDD